MIMCVLLCYPVSNHMSQLLSTGHPISSSFSGFLASYRLVLRDWDTVNRTHSNLLI